MNIQAIHPAEQLVMFMQRIYDKGLTTTSGGNLSIMDEEGNIWITPAAIDKGSLNVCDIVCVKPDGSVQGKHRPSSELPFHRAVYAMRPDLKAVLHAHPPALVSFSVARKVPNVDLLPTVRKLCPEMRISPYAVPGGEELGKNIGKCFMEGCDLVVLENHGVCIGGTDLSAAFLRFETLEYAATVEMLACRIGQPKTVSEQQSGNVDWCSINRQELTLRDRSAEECLARREMIELIRRAYRLGLLTGSQGVFSVRLSENSFLITPADIDRAYMEPDDLVFIEDCGADQEHGLSHTAALHQMIYRLHPEISSVFAAQPVHAMAFAVTAATFNTRIIPESYVLLRDVKRIPFGQKESNLQDTAAYFSETVPAAIVEHDCVIVTGNSALQAFDRLEVMELTAKSIMNAGSIGTMVDITDEEIEDIKSAFHLK